MVGWRNRMFRPPRWLIQRQAFDRLAAVGWLSRTLAPANRAGQIAGTFLVNMLTFRWPVLLLLSG
ncbi:hypothetical protein SMRU11_00130 (plasmid) [Sinorhizobium meliloti RU11/001]|nr:hypothetical protein SMRU11_00130 [Sinorhizobium meliloti RU11/001]